MFRMSLNAAKTAISQLSENFCNLLMQSDIQGYNTAEIAMLPVEGDRAVQTGLYRSPNMLKTLNEQKHRE